MKKIFFLSTIFLLGLDAFDAERSSSSDDDLSYFDLIIAERSFIAQRSSSAPVYECEEDFLFMKETSPDKNISSRSESLPCTLEKKVNEELEELGEFFGQNARIQHAHDRLQSPKLADPLGAHVEEEPADPKILALIHPKKKLTKSVPVSKKAYLERTAAARVSLEFGRSDRVPTPPQQVKKIIGFVVNGQ